MTTRLKYMSETVLKEFRDSVFNDIEMYVERDGHAEFKDYEYSIPLEIEYDTNKLSSLNHDSMNKSENQDLENSKSVGDSLCQLTPSLANEQRVWVRLSHTDCWEYSRNRWLRGESAEVLKEMTELHIFSRSRSSIRDHQAVARLWWNWYIAKMSWPSNPERALELILTNSDVRRNFIKRFWLCSREKIAGAVLRTMDVNPWILHRSKFGSFMKTINRYGGGIVFEAYSDSECDEFVEKCVHAVKKDQ